MKDLKDFLMNLTFKDGNLTSSSNTMILTRTELMSDSTLQNEERIQLLKPYVTNVSLRRN